ncbi:MAG: isopentenyl-diphosphate Delta-isomerase [Sphingobacterium sp.]|uniref:isopentenyl-diphosphate Delta-isomerase n=1 Tax=Sphingobacterium sp. JB170 TaxID=1434842 RepID=UPI00097F0567|nr:isopentenyl-diphosphate Delta-isomerase [Sphingobacterium sp. JB170]SJN47644.1 Isopentenyl-diphosphate delta-isomerase [Sphingobacterium sp. JB170]
MDRTKVVLVDNNDNPLGEMEKLLAHQQGQLHRAFSVFVFDNRGRLLLQQRADHKYHGAGLWTNTCCSHPQWGEDVALSALERLKYEMGMCCELKFSHSFIYQTPVENGLIENEYDYVYVGDANEDPVINPMEVQDFKWMPIDELLLDIRKKPDIYTYWFKVALPLVIADLKEGGDNL